MLRLERVITIFFHTGRWDRTKDKRCGWRWCGTGPKSTPTRPRWSSWSWWVSEIGSQFDYSVKPKPDFYLIISLIPNLISGYQDHLNVTFFTTGPWLPVPSSGSERVEWQGTAWVQHCSIAGAQRRAMMDEWWMEKMHIIITEKYIWDHFMRPCSPFGMALVRVYSGHGSYMSASHKIVTSSEILTVS